MLIKENFTLSKFHPSVAGPLSFYGVFDGHGGRQAAIYTRDHMFQFLVAELEQGKQPPEALRQAFLQTDSTFIAACRGDDKEGSSKDEQMEKEKDAASATPSQQPSAPSAAAPTASHVPPPINTSPSASAVTQSSSLDHDTSGTTAVAILLCHATHMLYVAHVGDSRAILLSAASVSPLTNDHKADRPDEVERIRAAGGFVVHKRVMGELAISRAIGDMDFKRPSSNEPGFNFVVADPEIGERQLKDDEDVLVLACDGLYDVMTNEKVAEYVRAGLQETGWQVQRVAESTVSHAIEKLFTRDNVTVIVVHLRKDGSSAAPAHDGGEPHHAAHIHHHHHHHGHHHAHTTQAPQPAAAVQGGDSHHHSAAHKPHTAHQQQQPQAVHLVPAQIVLGPSSGDPAREEVVHMQSDS